MPWFYRHRRADIDRLPFPDVVVIANGRPVDLPDGASVAGLLEALGVAGRVVVVERNGEPVDRSETATTPLADGDRCEVVRAVAGG
jgi:sulfur carrier protein